MVHGLLLAAAGWMGAGMNDLSLCDFSGGGYGAWTKTGTAFDQGPATGNRLEKLQIVNAGTGTVISSELQGDQPEGTLTSPSFVIERDFITFRIGGGDYERHCCMNLLVDGQVVKSATGRQSDRLQPQSWDVRAWRGKSATIQIVDHAVGDWGHINVDCLVQTDHPERLPVATEPLYQEKFRPQFHFTARQWTMDRLNPGMRQEGWINDLNGLIYYEGEYHLFAQRWHKCWLHAVSKDLIHWEELQPAFWAEKLDDGVQSGTSIIDYNNTSGLGKDLKNPPMIAFWSTVDNRSQALHYSLDRGRTWTPHPRNPILHFPERDPKVFWYEPGKHWVMMLYGDGKYHILTSNNLTDWKDEKNPIDNCFECPDFFQLPLDGDTQKQVWVLIQGNGEYSLGEFDGRSFKETSPRRACDVGPNFYATQSWEDTKTGDGRRIQAAWMRGSDFPDMPFSQQISIPCELTLRSTSTGPRIYRKPIREVETLHAKTTTHERLELGSAPVILAEQGDLYRIRATPDIPKDGSVTFTLRGIAVTLTDKTLASGGDSVEVPSGVKSVDILLDRGSVEVFVNDGEVSFTRYALPSLNQITVEGSKGSKASKVELIALNSIWVGKG